MRCCQQYDSAVADDWSLCVRLLLVTSVVCLAVRRPRLVMLSSLEWTSLKLLRRPVRSLCIPGEVVLRPWWQIVKLVREAQTNPRGRATITWPQPLSTRLPWARTSTNTLRNANTGLNMNLGAARNTREKRKKRPRHASWTMTLMMKTSGWRRI